MRRGPTDGLAARRRGYSRAYPLRARHGCRSDKRRWARGELDRAAFDYTMALRLDPRWEEVLEKRASVREAQGLPEAAAADRAEMEGLRAAAAAAAEAKAKAQQEATNKSAAVWSASSMVGH